MVLRARLALCLAQVLLLAAGSAAQEETCARRTVPVNVLTAEGDPVRNLAAGTWKAKFRGKPVKTLSEKWEWQPRRVVLLVDYSGSMRGKEGSTLQWVLTLGMTESLLRVAPPGTQFALFVFSTGPVFQVGFDQGRDVVLQNLAPMAKGQPQLVQDRNTALRDSILEALDLFNGPRPGDVIFLVTDGGDNRSQKSWADVERALLRSHVRLFAVNLAQVLPYPSLAGQIRYSQNELYEVVQATGGNQGKLDLSRYGLSHLKDNDLRLLAVQLAKQITELHWLEIELPVPVDKPRKWSLNWKPLSKTGPKHLQIMYPHTLMPCEARPPG